MPYGGRTEGPDLPWRLQNPGFKLMTKPAGTPPPFKTYTVTKKKEKKDPTIYIYLKKNL